MGGQFFKGYDRLVWCVIVVNAAGGMIVGMVRSQPASPSAPQTAHDRSNGEQEYIASRQTAEGQGETREQPSTAAQDGQKEQAAKSAKAPMQLHLLTGMASVLVLQVMKYADNILKGFATGISTLLSTLCSVVLFVRPRPRPRASYPLPLSCLLAWPELLL